MTGAGAAKHPGRWNHYKEAVVYCAPTIAMAVLETAAHIDDSGLPSNRYLIEIEVSDATWARREQVDVAKMPLGTRRPGRIGDDKGIEHDPAGQSGQDRKNGEL